MPSLSQRYLAQCDLINRLQGEKRASTAAVNLLAVSKTRPAEEILALYRLGQRDFGENYLQEAIQKQQQLAHVDINWHFIGPIQSNKTRDIARYFSWVHSIDRLKIAQRLDQQRPSNLPPLNACLQVNIDGEQSKSGFKLDELGAAVEALKGLNNLRIRGLMAIPQAGKSVNQQRASFKKLADAKNSLNDQFKLNLDTLSMGMSDDLSSAIAEGATMVRIGTAIFGSRRKSTV